MLGIYCRTSKNRTEKYTIDNQREGGIKCANQLNIGYRVYVDDGISGTLDESVRDGLSDLFRDIRKKEITHVYCIDQSRIERDTRTWDFFVAECLNNSIKYYPGGSEYSLDSDTNRMLARLMSVVNAYYSEITSKKVRLANARKAKEGKTHGLKPYGYKRGKDNKYEVYEEEAKNVRKMFELSLSGMGAYSIANVFNEENIPTKFSGNFTGQITRRDKYTKNKTKFNKSEVMWRGNVISDMLRNKIYKGIREWNRHEDVITFEDGKQVKRKVPVELVVSTDIPKIIEPSLWDAVNANLIENRKNVGKKEQYRYLLNGLLICAHCKNELLGKKRLKGNDNAYKCKGKRPPHKTCTESRGISLPKLESFIIQHLFHSKELKKLLLDAPKGNSEITKLKKSKERKEKEKDEAIKAKLHFEKLLKNPELNEIDSFVIDYKKWLTKLKNIEEQLESLIIQIAELEQESRKKRTQSLIESYTKNVEFNELKKIVHSLIEKIEIGHGKEKKSGYYIVIIKYRNYDEYSTFATNWQAMDWTWLNHYRGAAYSQEEFDDDYELELYRAKQKKREPAPKKDFEGFTTVSSMLGYGITLQKSDILQFD